MNASDRIRSMDELQSHSRCSSLCLLTCIALSTALAASGGGCSERSSSPSGSPPSKRLKILNLSTELTALDARGKRLKLDVSLEQVVKASVETSKALEFIETESGNQKAARMRVNARLLPDGFSKKLHAFIEARVSNTGTIPLTSYIDATLEELPESGSLDEEAYIKHLKRAVPDAIQALDEQAVLLSSGNKGLFKALDDDERDVRMAAIRTLGERKATDAVEPLCGVLRREKNEVGQAALGALVMIDEEKAVPCVIQWAGSDDRRLVLALEPLSTIGGREAQAFLEMIASGHEDPRIKSAAEESLRRLEASSKAP